jgi:hypothetical protein
MAALAPAPQKNLRFSVKINRENISCSIFQPVSRTLVCPSLRIKEYWPNRHLRHDHLEAQNCSKATACSVAQEISMPQSTDPTSPRRSALSEPQPSTVSDGIVLPATARHRKTLSSGVHEAHGAGTVDHGGQRLAVPPRLLESPHLPAKQKSARFFAKQ